ncbi:hypothetical protein FOA43_003905 [Brettanomyces nanus]|uniref:RAVE complex protein Rav1 C-terminal domain-containing protein n=1 Tax=Eeniella nana TaxID=13502 RepID=A0A875S5D5_EENNA|nr:uncharacterized protein FOA43_003905 [Brettanomyces nanus]QPG76516.1 hypothetical protein FOA43_003905 [Brettanomyces nanus]
MKIKNDLDSTKINCLSWSDTCEIKGDEFDADQFMSLPNEFHSQTTCELVAGSEESLTLWRFYYKIDGDKNQKHIASKVLWHKDQPSSVYMVKFSPSASCIVSTGYCDRLVKLWYRLSYGIETADFELYYIPHPNVVTSLKWKSYPMESISSCGSRIPSRTGSRGPSDLDVVKTSNGIIKLDLSRLGFPSDGRSVTSMTSDKRQHNVLYTVSADSVLHVYSTYKLDSVFEVYFNGSIDLFDGEPDAKERGIKKFVSFIDNSVAEIGISKVLQTLENEYGPATESTSVSISGSLSKYGENSIYGSRSESIPRTERSNKSQALEDLLQEKVEICMVFDNDSHCKLYCLGNLNKPVPTKMTIYPMDQKFDTSGKAKSCNIVFGEHCMPCDCRAIAIHHILLSRHMEDTELTMVIQDLFKSTIRVVGFSFKDIFDFSVKYTSTADEHSFFGNGSITARNSLVEGYLPKKDVTIGILQDKLTGHNKSVRRLIGSTDGTAVLSTTRFNRSLLWFIMPLGHHRTTLNKKSSIITPTPILDAAIWRKGDYVVAAVEGSLICYDCRLKSQFHKTITKLAPEMCSLPADTGEKAMCFFLLPEASKDICHLVAVFKDKSCKAWEMRLLEDGNKAEIRDFKIGALSECQDDKLHMVSSVDPVGWNTSIEFVGRDVLITITTEGFVRVYYASLSGDGIVWHLKNSFLTGVKECSFLSGSSVNKVALASMGTDKLTIWDTRLGRLEYEEDFGETHIRDIDWTATAYHQAILSVGFSSYALLYTQIRYDYTNKNPAFVKIKRVSIAEQTTHDIGDSIWMTDGLLVMGAGNQFYISDKSLDANTDDTTNRAIGTLEIVSDDIFHLCSALNGPLPLYHPQFIIQTLLIGRFAFVEAILVRLCNALRDLDLGGTKSIDASLDLDYRELFASKDESSKLNSKNAGVYDNLFDTIDDGSKNERFSAEIADILIEKLQRFKLPYLTGHQQITLSYTISIVKDILLKYRKILDNNALRYYIGVRLFHINVSKTASPTTRATKTITMRDVTFAMHSDNKDLLYNIINEQSDLKLDWLNAKRYGLPYWLNLQRLTEAMEKIARNEFFGYEEAHDGKKDPSKCSIFYMALKKKHIVLGLWKTASGHPEQGKMIRFLNHDFEEMRWKKAAVKNAYVLMAKHRYMDAAYFFLLADAVNDCVDVIIQKLGDVPLAIAISRTYDQSDHGESLKRILVRHVLPKAIEENDRWHLSWCFWAFHDRLTAIQSLIKPIEILIEDIKRIVPEFQTFKGSDIHKINSANNEDPVLLVMYQNLRNRNVKYLEGAQKLGPEAEFDFVIKAATMYQSMGCDWLALLITKNWEFVSSQGQLSVVAPETRKSKSTSQDLSPTRDHAKASSRLNGYMKSELEKPSTTTTASFKQRVQPSQSAFEEPDMSAFDFGF